MNCHNIGVLWGPYIPLTAPKIIFACLEGCRLSIRHAGAECKASFGAQGGHFCWRRSWLAMVVLVDVGSWRLTSDRPTVGVVKIVYGSIYYSYVYPIQSWHLTRQLNKEEFDPCTCNISWLLCPNFYGITIFIFFFGKMVRHLGFSLRFRRWHWLLKMDKGFAIWHGNGFV